MSTPLKLLAAVIFASIFLGIVVSLHEHFSQTQSKAQFLQDAEELADRASALQSQDPGAKQEFSITIPSGCRLDFKGENVIANVDGESHMYSVGVNITGLTLEDTGDYDLWIERMSGGIEVSVK